MGVIFLGTFVALYLESFEVVVAYDCLCAFPNGCCGGSIGWGEVGGGGGSSFVGEAFVGVIYE